MEDRIGARAPADAADPRDRRSVRRAALRRMAAPAAERAAGDDRRRQVPLPDQCPRRSRRGARFPGRAADEGVRDPCVGRGASHGGAARAAGAPGPQLVRMAAATVGHIDRTVWSGGFLLHPPLPYVPGVEAAGTVVAERSLCRGPARLAARRRARHAQDGTWRELDRCARRGARPAARRGADGAGHRLLLALHLGLGGAARGRRAAGGERVLVTGASGAVGSIAVQLARAPARCAAGPMTAAAALPAGVERIAR